MPAAAEKPDMQRRVLVVEDEHEVCALLTEFLEDDGFRACCVQTAEQAYTALRRGEEFACMIVDVNLGAGHTGYDVARFARTIDPQLPVIFVSGQTSPDSFRAHAVPGGLLVPKPFTAAELMAELVKLVGQNDD